MVQFFVKTSKLKLIYFWKYELKTLKIWGMHAIGISYNHVLVKNKITGFLLFLLSLSLSLYIYIYPEKKNWFDFVYFKYTVGPSMIKFFFFLREVLPEVFMLNSTPKKN